MLARTKRHCMTCNRQTRVDKSTNYGCMVWYGLLVVLVRVAEVVDVVKKKV
jgi:hypothetical protein